MTDPDEEYPSLRRALFGDEAANLYCGIKWLCWQLFNVLFAIFATLVILLSGVAFVCLMGIHYCVLLIAGAVRSLLPERSRTAAPRAAAARRDARETPVVRRIYGYCPVDFRSEPRWFERLSWHGSAAIDWMTPPEWVWVRDCGCGSAWSFEPDETECKFCGEGEFVRVVEGSDRHAELLDEDGDRDD